MARRKKVEGIENVRRVFQRLPEASLERITHALNQGGDEIVTAAKQAVPVGTDPHHVRDTIRRTEIRLRADTMSALVFVTAGDTKETWTAAFRSEFGRAPGGSGVNVGHPGHKEQPFMFPAYWAKRKRVIGRIRREIRRAARFASGLRSKA